VISGLTAVNYIVTVKQPNAFRTNDTAKRLAVLTCDQECAVVVIRK